MGDFTSPNFPCLKNDSLCARYPDKCHLCINESMFLASKTKTKKTTMRKYKKSERMGAGFEEFVKENINKDINTSANLTPNSGAGTVKGDIEISGCIDVALELKTKIKPKITRGSYSFTIQKEWLDKLERESKEANKEFWALVFNFNENDKSNVYSIIDLEQFNSIISTMVHDRTKYNTIKVENELFKMDIEKMKSEILNKDFQIDILKKEIAILKSTKLLNEKVDKLEKEERK